MEQEYRPQAKEFFLRREEVFYLIIKTLQAAGVPNETIRDGLILTNNTDWYRPRATDQ